MKSVYRFGGMPVYLINPDNRLLTGTTVLASAYTIEGDAVKDGGSACSQDTDWHPLRTSAWNVHEQCKRTSAFGDQLCGAERSSCSSWLFFGLSRRFGRRGQHFRGNGRFAPVAIDSDLHDGCCVFAQGHGHQWNGLQL